MSHKELVERCAKALISREGYDIPQPEHYGAAGTVIDEVLEVAALMAEDSAKDAMPDSEYALACNDLAELLRSKKSDWVKE